MLEDDVLRTSSVAVKNCWIWGVGDRGGELGSRRRKIGKWIVDIAERDDGRECMA